MLDFTSEKGLPQSCVYICIPVYYSYGVDSSPEPYEPDPPVPVIEDLLTIAEFIESDTPVLWLRRSLILSEEIKKVTALATKGQRKNPM